MRNPGILVVFGLASAVCDFGPLTPVEVRAFGSLAYQAFSTPRERSPAVLREQAIREELHFELGQIGASSPPARELPSAAQTAKFNSPLRGGDGVPAFMTGCSVGLNGFRRCSSSQDILHRPLEIAVHDLQHRAVAVRRATSIADDLVSRQMLGQGMVSQPMMGASSSYEPMQQTAFAKRELLYSQGALHHLRVIAKAARKTPWGTKTTAHMTAVPGGEIPQDSSLSYPPASRRERWITAMTAAASAATAIAVMTNTQSTLLSMASILRLVLGSLLSFAVGKMTATVFLAEMRYSVYLLYWYKSTNTDAEGAAEHRIHRYLRLESEAAYPDSKFVGAGAVTAHYLEALPSSGNVSLTLLCLHGFGSSCASYRLVLQPLSDALQARVLAVDMPGFGLTTRPASIKDFCPNRMLSHFVEALGLVAGGAAGGAAVGGEAARVAPLVVMGHSLGGLVAAKHVISSHTAHSSLAAAVLVAPLVVQSRAADTAAGGWGGHARGGVQRLPSTRMLASMLVKAALGVASVFLKYAFQGVVKVLTPVFALVLRRMVYTPDFWVQALGGTYHDRANLNAEIVSGYRRGSWVKGWDTGLLNFVRFRVSAGKSPFEMLREVYRTSFTGAPSAASTPMALKATGTPLLFIHGDADKVIPAANSRFVSSFLSGQVEYVEVQACGHSPMEERPAEFVALVAAFLNRNLPAPAASSSACLSTPPSPRA